MSTPDLNTWCLDMLGRLGPGGRAAMARQIAASLKKTQRQRIAAQLNPDGSPYEPRKPRLRRKRGRIRRTMFAKISKSHIQIKHSANSAIVELSSQVQRIARVHHYGLRDKIDKTGPDYQYPARQLLGLNDREVENVKDIVINSLTR